MLPIGSEPTKLRRIGARTALGRIFLSYRDPAIHKSEEEGSENRREGEGRINNRNWEGLFEDCEN